LAERFASSWPHLIVGFCSYLAKSKHAQRAPELLDGYINDQGFVVSPDIKYGFSDNSQKTDLVINFNDSTLSLSNKQLVAIIDTFAPLFLKKH